MMDSLDDLSGAPLAKKSLGQHWLRDDTSLRAMTDAVEVGAGDTVLEIGPGLGTLTAELLCRGAHVIAVEFDGELARDLPRRAAALLREKGITEPAKLQVVHEDIMRFDLATLPSGYKVAANIPYYLTSNLLRKLCEAGNPFSRAALLVQKEVAERVCAGPGALSVLALSVQFYCRANLGQLVPAAFFTPPPKVDSQILQLTRRTQPLFEDVEPQAFFRLVKLGFAQRRKTLLNSLGAGLHLDRAAAQTLLARAGISPTVRAQQLIFADWHALYQQTFNSIYRP